jgi:hypothetical protein
MFQQINILFTVYKVLFREIPSLTFLPSPEAESLKKVYGRLKGMLSGVRAQAPMKDGLSLQALVPKEIDKAKAILFLFIILRETVHRWWS